MKIVVVCLSSRDVQEATLSLFASPKGILNLCWSSNVSEFKKSIQVNEQMTHIIII